MRCLNLNVSQFHTLLDAIRQELSSNIPGYDVDEPLETNASGVCTVRMCDVGGTAQYWMLTRSTINDAWMFGPCDTIRFDLERKREAINAVASNLGRSSYYEEVLRQVSRDG